MEGEQKLFLVHDNPKVESLEQKRAPEDGEENDVEERWEAKVDKSHYRLPKFATRHGGLSEFEFWRTRLEEYNANLITEFLKRLEDLSRTLPFLKKDFFIHTAGVVRNEIETVLQEEEIQGVQEEKISQYERLSLPYRKLYFLQEELKEEVQRESKKYFAPLIERARADVRMYLLKEINTKNIDPLEAEKFLTERFKINLPVQFTIDINLFRPPESRQVTVAASTDSVHSIKINLEAFDVTENGELNEAEILGTLVHEIIHNLSARGEDGDIGLAKEDIFEEETPSGKSPETYLNEITTEMLTFEIMTKYFQEKLPGTLQLKKEQKQEVWGYQRHIEDFQNLREKHSFLLDELIALSRDAMFRGTGERVKDFFSQHPDLFFDVKAVCLKSWTAEREDYKLKAA